MQNASFPEAWQPQHGQYFQARSQVRGKLKKQNEAYGWFLLDGNPASPQTVLEVLPTHTDKTFRFDRRSFIAISPDSLDRLLRDQIIYTVQLSGNEAFTANYETFRSTEKTNVRSLNLNLVERLTIFELPDQAVTAA